MAQTTTAVGRAGINMPDQGYDAQIDGGTALHTAVNAAIAQISNNLIGRWSDSLTLAAFASVTFNHKFGQSLSNLKVIFFESNALISKSTQDSKYTVSQVDTNNIQISNITGGSLTFQIYVIAFPLSVRSADIDASIDATITRLYMAGGMLLAEMATPSTPSSGQVAVYAKSDKKLYTKDSNGTESQVGTGSGGFDIIWSDDFENNATTNWALYNDGASATPVDMAGGSVTGVTFTASSSSPIDGNYSAIFSKDASNRQGMGVARSFSLNSNSAFKSTTVQLIMNVIADSSMSSGDVTLYMYDVTNSSLITPANINLPTGTTGNHTIAFYLTTGTSYRFGMHIASTSSTAYTVKIDSVRMSSISRPLVPAISDWQSYTPTGSFNTNTTYTGKYKFDGDDLLCNVHLSFAGAPNSTTLTSITIPSNLTIDTTKLLATNAGDALPFSETTIVDSGTAKYVSSPVWYVNTTTVQPTYDNGSGIATAITQAAPITIASGDSIDLTFRVPITNKSSNITLASTTPAIEYQSNSSSTDADNTSSFVSGAQGSTGIIGATSLTAARAKRIQFSNPIQPTDRIQIELGELVGGIRSWVPLGAGFRTTTGSPISPLLLCPRYTGIGYQSVSGSNTQLDIVFGTDANQNTASYNTQGDVWTRADFANVKWRVAKVSSIGAAEIAPATETSQGIIKHSGLQSYPPTLTGFGTCSSITGLYSYDNGRLYVQVVFTAGTPTATEARISLPGTYTTTALYGTLHFVGSLDAQGTENGYLTVYSEASKTYVTFGNTTSAQDGLTKRNGNGIAGAGQLVSVFFTVFVS